MGTNEEEYGPFVRVWRYDQSSDEPRSESDELRFLVGTVFDISQTVEIQTGADDVV